MLLNVWKQLNVEKGMNEISYRNMIGYTKEKDGGRSTIFFPESLIKTISERLPRTSIYNACYRMRKSSYFEREKVYLKLVVDTVLVRVEFEIEKTNDFAYSSHFSFIVNREITEPNEEMKGHLTTLFHQMKMFVEDHSPNRLFYLSSTVTENYPEWIEVGV